MLKTIRKWFKLNPEPPGLPFQAPVFIIGCMRSGTTFLVDKLTQHPQLLKVGSELRGVWTEIGGAPCGGKVGSYRGSMDAKPTYAANMAAYFQDFVHQSQSVNRHLMRAKQKWKQGSSAIFYDWERVIPVNKSTHLVNKIAYLHALFPKARFIFILRDLPAQVASLKVHSLRHFDQAGTLLYAPEAEKDSWGQGARSLFGSDIPDARFFPEHFSLIPEMWVRLNQLALTELSELPPARFRVIEYQDLVSHQASILGQVFDFLELHPQHRSQEERIAGTKMKIINTTSAGNPLDKWKHTLDAGEQKIVQQFQQSSACKAVQQQLKALKLNP